MSRSRNTQIYLPPTELQLNQFTDELDKIWCRFANADGLHSSLDLERRVTLADDSVQRIDLSFSFDDNTEVFQVELGRAVEVEDLWSTPLMKATMDAYNEHFGMDEVSSDDDEPECTEGYIEHQRKLKVVRGVGHISSSLTCLYTLYDMDFEAIDAHIAFSPEVMIVGPKEETEDLETLLTEGLTMLDLKNLEESQSIPSRADLIMFTNALASSGFMKKKTRAYKGAPRCADRMKLLTTIHSLSDDIEFE